MGERSFQKPGTGDMNKSSIRKKKKEKIKQKETHRV